MTQSGGTGANAEPGSFLLETFHRQLLQVGGTDARDATIERTGRRDPWRILCAMHHVTERSAESKWALIIWYSASPREDDELEFGMGDGACSPFEGVLARSLACLLTPFFLLSRG